MLMLIVTRSRNLPVHVATVTSANPTLYLNWMFKMDDHVFKLYDSEHINVSPSAGC